MSIPWKYYIKFNINEGLCKSGQIKGFNKVFSYLYYLTAYCNQYIIFITSHMVVGQQWRVVGGK